MSPRHAPPAALFRSVGDGAVALFRSVGDGAIAVFRGVCDGAVALFRSVCDGAIALFRSVYDGAIAVFRGVGDGAAALFRRVCDGAAALFRGLIRLRRKVAPVSWPSAILSRCRRRRASTVRSAPDIRFSVLQPPELWKGCGGVAASFS